MTTIDRKHTNQRMSQSVTHGGLVYLAGQIAQKNAGAPVDVQTREVLDSIDTLLAEQGTDKTRILSASVWLTDIATDFAAFNEVWDAWAPEGNAPARACVGAKLVSDAFKVEVAVIAAKN